MDSLLKKGLIVLFLLLIVFTLSYNFAPDSDVFKPFQGLFAPYAIAPLDVQGVEIIQPYVDKVILANSDASYSSPYRWYVNGGLVESGTAGTTFLAHFDNSLNAEDGTAPYDGSSVVFEQGQFNNGFVGAVNYTTTNNLDLDEGTIEFWATFKEPIDSPVFDGSAREYYFFRHKSSFFSDEYQQDVTAYFQFLVRSQNDLSFTAYDGDWADAQQLAIYEEIPVNEPIYFALTYSKSQNRISLYMNGFKVAQDTYDFNSPLEDKFQLGNDNIVIDEFRIYDRFLTYDEVKQNYVRGIPFSKNDIYYDGSLNVGDTLRLEVDSGGSTLTSQSSVLASKINIISPDGYFVQNGNSFVVSFNTTSSLICAYDSAPRYYSDLSNLESSSSTQHTISVSVPTTVDYYPMYIKCGDDDYAFYRRFRVLPDVDTNAPLLGKLWWGGDVDSDNQTELEYLSRFGVLAVSKSNQAEFEAIDDIRTLNPQMIILPYVESISYQNYSQYAYEDLIDDVEDSMRLQNSSGDFVSNLGHPSNILCNLYVGNNFSDAVSTHVAEEMMSEGIWDGLWYDSVDSSLWFLKDFNTNQYYFSPDFEMDGVDENLNDPDTLTYARGLWGVGESKLMELTRNKSGQNMIIVGNGADRTPGLYNGKLWEYKFETYAYTPASVFMDYDNNSYSFPFWNENVVLPNLNWNLVSNTYSESVSPTLHYKRHRFGLAASIIGGVYYEPRFDSSGEQIFQWYDEYWVDLESAAPSLDSSDRGYLGQPLSNVVEIQTDVWKREFENGIVLLNALSTSVSIDLDETYRYIDGTEDSAVNKGGFTSSSVTLSGKDGLILLRALCSDNPSDDTNCIAVCGDGTCDSSESCSSCSADCGSCAGTNIGGGGTTPDEEEEDTTNTITSSHSCGDGTCDSSESCNSCTTDCGECPGETNQIDLDDNYVVELNTRGGQYTVNVGFNQYIISIYSITEDSLKMTYGDETLEIGLSSSGEFKLDGEFIVVSYLDNNNGEAKLSFSRRILGEPSSFYQSKEFGFFIIAFVVYLIILVVLFWKRKSIFKSRS